MKTRYNRNDAIPDYFVIEGYQEGCGTTINNEPTGADFDWLAYHGKLYGFLQRNVKLLR